MVALDLDLALATRARADGAAQLAELSTGEGADPFAPILALLSELL